MTTDLPEPNLISQGVLTPTQVEQYGIAYAACSLPTRAGLLVQYYANIEELERQFR